MRRGFFLWLMVLVFCASCDDTSQTNNDAGNNVNNVNNNDTPPDFMKFPARVSEIVDGDTIWVWIGDKRLKVRFLGVNTPETYGTVEYYGPEAKQYTRDSLPLSSWVGLEFDNELCGSATPPTSCYDMYDRLLAYIRTLEDRDHCAQLVVNGYARVYTDASFSRKTYYLQLQDEAVAACRGLWGEAR